MFKRVIIDTSAILFGFKFKKNVFEIVEERFHDAQIVVSRGVIRELTGISSNKGKNAAIARFALLTLKSKKLEVHNININVDAWVLKSARISDIVITNDTELSNALRSKGITVLKMSRNGLLKLF